MQLLLFVQNMKKTLQLIKIIIEEIKIRLLIYWLFYTGLHKQNRFMHFTHICTN
jgi:hypothetical protein